MDMGDAARRFSALGHEGRLELFRILADAGQHGLPAGEVGRRAGMLQNTASSNLNILQNAGLIVSRRDGRSILYAINEAAFSELLEFLVQDSFGGRSDLQVPFLQRLLAISSAAAAAAGRARSVG